MMIKKVKSLTLRVTFFVVFLSVISGILSEVYTYVVASNLVNQVIKEQVKSKIEGLAAALSSPVWTFNHKAIQNTVNEVLSSKGMITFVAFKIEDSQGKEVFFESKLKDLEIMNLLQKYDHLLKYEDEDIGKITVWMDDSNLKTELKNASINLILVLLIVLGMFALTTYFILKTYINQPLMVLQKSAGHFLRGDLKTRIDENLDEEFLLLANAYNKMFDDIEKRDFELRSYNHDLEILVLERTKESDQQKALLMQASKLATLGEFAGNVAHEINNPLSVIQGNAQLLSKALKDQQFDKVEKSKEKILAMVDRIGKIISGLRSFARDGSLDSMQPFEIKKFLETISDLSFRRLESRGIDLKFDCTVEDRFLLGREVQFSQVIMNLINNAADAIESLDEKWIHLSCETIGDQLLLKITDSGRGISPEIQQKLMTPFFTTKPIGKGTGLGLSISMGIVKDHGGSLYYNPDSPNTQFCLKIPRYFPQGRKVVA